MSEALHIKGGWLVPREGVVLHPECVFFNDRPEGMDPTLVLLHAITVPAYEMRTEGVQALFLGHFDPKDDKTLESLKGLQVSSHFFIDRMGVVHQFVCTQKRAWHAGVSRFLGRDNCNDFSVGIELEGSDFVPFEPKQYESLKGLLRALFEAHPVTDIAAHSDVAPGRKTDPGPYFDWSVVERLTQAFPHVHLNGAAARLWHAVHHPMGTIA